MGLFSFIGKALKGVSKVAGVIPGIGGTISKISGFAGGLLDHKKPMNKPMMRDPRLARGNMTQMGAGVGFTPQVLRATPILPGGAISTPSGIRASMGHTPPMSYGGGSRRRGGGLRALGVAAGQGRRKRRRKSAARASGRKRSASGRRLKFGSAAWRARYMKRRRR